MNQKWNSKMFETLSQNLKSSRASSEITTSIIPIPTIIQTPPSITTR